MENLANVMHSVVLVQRICMNSAGNMTDIFPFVRLILRCPAIFLGVFFLPRKLKDVARSFACHANIWLFAASVASTWAFRFGMLRGGSR